MKKSKGNSIIFKSLAIILFSVITLVLFVMLYLTIVTSLKTLPDFMSNVIGLPKEWKFKNYLDAFVQFKEVKSDGSYVFLGEMLFYTLLYAGGCAFFATITPCIVAYCCAKYDVWLNKILYGTVIVGMILPIVGALPSSIQIMKALGLYNTMVGMWIMKFNYMGTYFLIFYATFKSLSNGYKEAATIDGASEYQVLLRISLPLVKSTMIAVFVLNFIAFWNDYQTPLIYLKDYPTAAVGLFNYVYAPSVNTVSTKPMQMAGCMILFIPVFTLFLCFRNLFLGNLTVGGLKD